MLVPQDQFISVCTEENWRDHKLAEPSYVLVADDWYPDKDWSAKWNCQLSKAGVKIAENYQCHDAHLAMVSDPELIMAVDRQGNSTPIASGIMVVKGIYRGDTVP